MVKLTDDERPYEMLACYRGIVQRGHYLMQREMIQNAKETKKH